MRIILNPSEVLRFPGSDSFPEAAFTYMHQTLPPVTAGSNSPGDVELVLCSLSLDGFCVVLPASHSAIFPAPFFLSITDFVIGRR
jgi:hypothetical protein